MPLYEYECAACAETFTELRSVAKRADPVACSACRAPDARPILSSFAVRSVTTARPSSLAQQLGGLRASTPTSTETTSIISHGCNH